MKKLLLKNKILSIMFILVIISNLIGIFFTVTLNTNTKEIVNTSLQSFVENSKSNNINIKTTLKKSLKNNIITNSLLFFLGISAIGIPILIIVLIIKNIINAFTFSSFIYIFKAKGIIYGIIYTIPEIINLCIYFVMSYYAIQFSLMIFNYLFRKKEYKKNIIVKRYLKIYLITTILLSITAFLETYIIPKAFNII